MRVLRQLFFLALLLLAGHALGSDLPYGSDGLPHLVSDASLIADCISAETMPLGDNSQATLVKLYFSRILKGDGPSSGSLLVLLPAEEVTLDRFSGSIAFLRGPLSLEDLRFWGVLVSGQPVFRLINTELGVVNLGSESRELVEKYLSPADAPFGQDPMVNWAKAAIDARPNDPFMQRSIIYELERHPDDPRALKFLGWATRLHWLPKSYRSLAIGMLGQNGSKKALDELQQTATDQRVLFEIRSASIEEVSEHPEGEQVLRKLSRSKDKLLVNEVKRILADTVAQEKPNGI